MVRLKIVVFVFFFLMFLPTSFAATNSLSGSTSLGEGKSGSAILKTNGNGELIAAIGGFFSSSDSSCVKVTSVTASHSFTTVNGFKIAYLDLTSTGYSGYRDIALVNYQAVGTNCSATITYNHDMIGSTEATTLTGNNSSVKVSVLSNDNNLTSLSTNVGNISFNSNTISYSINVDSNVTSAVINASANNTAKVSGVGTKSLGYGSNKFNVVVTAQSGVTKTYTVNIIRKDDRSTINTLKTLIPDVGILSPTFDSGTTNYKLLIPFENDSVIVTADPTDSKAKVTVLENSGFVSEETKDMYVKVVAENGSEKTYTISVTRGKDPNKPLSENNNLASLEINAGTLSPAFFKEQTEYLVWLPYEIETFDFNFAVEDSKWASYEVIKTNELQVGMNKQVIKVTAENGSTKEYIINVSRGYSSKSNETRDSLLKQLNIENGSLTEEFSSNKTTYYYKSNEKLTFSAIPNFEDSEISLFENEDVYSILVRDINGNSTLYVLKPYKSIFLVYLIPFVFILVIIGIFSLKKVKQKSEKSRHKSERKTKRNYKK